jgi:ADA HAT complex component 1
MSNNAPSLVSDDGEYDDSEDASSMSGHSEAVDAESVSDVADISMDEDHGHRSLRRSSTGISSAVRLRREEPKHVTFVSPLANTRDTKRKRNA